MPRCLVPAVTISLLLALAISARAQSAFEPLPVADESCTSTTGCPAVIAETTYEGHKAYRLSDGHSEAIIVPDFGRVMDYRLAGGKNLLWTATRHKFGPNEWRNYGGAKTWPSPQDAWPALVGRKWPPPEAWDDIAASEVLSGGSLRLTSVIDASTGTRLIREFGLADDGDLTISQTVEKLSGVPVTLGIWSIAQTPTPDFVLMPQQVRGNYAGYHWIDKAVQQQAIATWNHGILQASPTLTEASNLAADASEAWIVSVSNGIAFARSLVSNATGSGQPDYSGTFPVAFFCTGSQNQPYAEMELLSPLHRFTVDSRWTRIDRWHVENLPSPNAHSPETRSAIEEIVANLRKGA